MEFVIYNTNILDKFDILKMENEMSVVLAKTMSMAMISADIYSGPILALQIIERRPEVAILSPMLFRIRGPFAFYDKNFVLTAYNVIDRTSIKIDDNTADILVQNLTQKFEENFSFHPFYSVDASDGK